MNEGLLKKGSVDFEVRISGILQIHRFIVSSEKTAFGDIPVLSPERNIKLPLTEAIKAANELGLPVRSASGLVFPKGKFARDFAKG